MGGEKKKKTDKVAGKTTDKIVKKTINRTANKAAEKVEIKATEKVVRKAGGKSADKVAGKAATRTAGKTSSKEPSAETSNRRVAGPASAMRSSPPAGKAKRSVPVSAPEGTLRRQASHMDDLAFIGKMEQSLLVLKAEINENLIATSNDFKEIVEGIDPKDLADIASDDIDRKIIEALGSQVLKRLKLIDSALGRIKQGNYGLCIKCGKHIPPERLEAIPYAVMCIACKSEEERRNR